MLALIKSHTDFLKAAHSTIAPATWPSIAAAHATKLQANISNLVSVDVQDAASALAMLSDSCFDAESKASIAASINTRVSGPASESSTCRTSLKTHEHLFFGNYLTACDWHVLGSPGSCMDDRIGTIVERAWRVGLLSMTERTSQSITCVIMSSFAGDVDPSHCHQVMLDMKAAFRQMRLKRSSACLPTLAKFPESVDQFMLQCPGKYDASDMPVPPKCDATKMNRLRSNLACRKSHTTLRDTSAAMPSSGSNAMMMQALPLQHCATACRADVGMVISRWSSHPQSDTVLLLLLSHSAMQTHVVREAPPIRCSWMMTLFHHPQPPPWPHLQLCRHLLHQRKNWVYRPQPLRSRRLSHRNVQLLRRRRRGKARRRPSEQSLLQGEG